MLDCQIKGVVGVRKGEEGLVRDGKNENHK